jgi:hypothetical protein
MWDDYRTVRVLPVEGPYWWEERAVRVLEVEEGEPAVVHLVADDERHDSFYKLLPAGWIIRAGRSGDTGEWHAHVFASDASRRADVHPLAAVDYSSDCDTAVSRAVAQALEVLRARESRAGEEGGA